ncbi:hypothetical protein [Arthrobacter sp. UYCo732]|uniref:hypothetical protein n=1 Tax=Arthrobacter sp. UYCo732 TaxID=3156336 RepID=UPI003391CCC1
MTDTIARQPQGIPVGGQFAPTTHAEPGFDLHDSSPAVPVAFQGSIDLRESAYGSLPPLPASVGTPEVTFDFNIDGKLETHVTVDGSTLTFWNDDMADEITNTIESGRSGEDESAPWSNIAEYEDWEQARTWAESVHERIYGANLDVMTTAATQDAARASIISFATCRSKPAPDLTPEQSSAKRAAAAVAIVDEGQGKEYAMRDLFTDLRHYADKHGIDIYKAMDDSLGLYQHETTDPSFKEGY